MTSISDTPHPYLATKKHTSSTCPEEQSTSMGQVWSSQEMEGWTSPKPTVRKAMAMNCFCSISRARMRVQTAAVCGRDGLNCWSLMRCSMGRDPVIHTHACTHTYTHTMLIISHGGVGVVVVLTGIVLDFSYSILLDLVLLALLELMLLDS